MKILFFIHKLYGGGAERVASILMNHLCENHNVSAIIFENIEKPYHLSSNIHIHKISVNNRFRIIRIFKRLDTIRKEIKEESPDIIISFLTPINIFMLTSKIFLRKKAIISERNTLNRVQSRFVRFLRKIIYPLADKIVFVTKADCNTFGLPPKSVTIYNPAIFAPFTDYTERQNTIVTIAPTDRWYNKGLDVLLSAWTKIAAQNPDWNLEIYGNNNYAQIVSISQDKQERVSWKGWNDDIVKVLRTNSIFVLASRFEGCPNSLIEAMSQGCACIGTDCEGGIKEIITDGKSGLLAHNDDVDDLSAKLQLLIENEPLRQKLSVGALEEVKRFDKELIMKQWDELIQLTIES